jgi:hypothetical protein
MYNLTMGVDGQQVHPFRVAAERHDIDALMGTLAPEVVLHSPVTFAPYVGKENVGGLLRLVSEAFDGWRCVEEVHGPDGVIGFVFRTQVEGRELEGLDLLRLDSDGDRRPDRDDPPPVGADGAGSGDRPQGRRRRAHDRRGSAGVMVRSRGFR